MIESDPIAEKVAAVVIGRNEGPRLHTCLKSLLPEVMTLVYVDSGSVDSSIRDALQLGAKVVELDTRQPFTAARGRNSGVAALNKLDVAPKFVQFVDGDCQIQPGWIRAGVQFLESNPDYAVVCGRRRERFPRASIYNRLCDYEWSTPVGDALACGGDALMRIDAFQQIGGFNDGVIAGEEPELCVRLRQSGWKIMRLDQEMTLHDAAMTRFTQWWTRAKRGGYAYAQGAALHGGRPECHWVRECRRDWFWAAFVPTLTLVMVMAFGPIGFCSLLLYGVVWAKTFMHARGRTSDAKAAALWASACVVGKFAELQGQMVFWWRRFRGTTPKLIEYKSSPTPSTTADVYSAS